MSCAAVTIPAGWDQFWLARQCAVKNPAGSMPNYSGDGGFC